MDALEEIEDKESPVPVGILNRCCRTLDQYIAKAVLLTPASLNTVTAVTVLSDAGVLLKIFNQSWKDLETLKNSDKLKGSIYHPDSQE